jgi:hypothetical protein
LAHLEALRSKNSDNRLSEDQVLLVKEAIFFNGIESASRPYLWKNLVSYHKWQSSEEERKEKEAQGKQVYAQLKQSWITSLAEKSDTVSGIELASILENKNRIGKMKSRYYLIPE